MLLARILLFGNGAVFLLYGLACVFSPNRVAEYSAMELSNASALTEVVAMYGGLQAGIGVLFLYNGFRPARVPAGLSVMVLLLGSLALGRTFGLLIYGMSQYNILALVYESLSALLAFVAMRRIGARRAEV
jgi:hypothetical protein